MDKCNAKELLKSHGLKATRQRLVLLEYIIKNQGIFSANFLFTKFANDMDLVTIYRVLNVFESIGLIREIFSSDDVKKYELACIHNPVHPHFSCRICGTLYCLDALNETDLYNLEQSCSGFIVENVAMQFSGICYKCK